MNAIPAIVASTVSRHCNCTSGPSDPLLNILIGVVLGLGLFAIFKITIHFARNHYFAR